MSDFEVKSIELQVKSSAEQAYNALDILAKKLDSIASSIDKVVSLSRGLATLSNVKVDNITKLANALSKVNNSIVKVNTQAEKQMAAQKKALEAAKAAQEALKRVDAIRSSAAKSAQERITATLAAQKARSEAIAGLDATRTKAAADAQSRITAELNRQKDVAEKARLAADANRKREVNEAKLANKKAWAKGLIDPSRAAEVQSKMAAATRDATKAINEQSDAISHSDLVAKIKGMSADQRMKGAVRARRSNDQEWLNAYEEATGKKILGGANNAIISGAMQKDGQASVREYFDGLVGEVSEGERRLIETISKMNAPDRLKEHIRAIRENDKEWLGAYSKATGKGYGETVSQFIARKKEEAEAAKQAAEQEKEAERQKAEAAKQAEREAKEAARERAREEKEAARERVRAEKEAAREAAAAEKEAARQTAEAQKEMQRRSAETNQRLKSLLSIGKRIPGTLVKGIRSASSAMTKLGHAATAPVKLIGKLFSIGAKSGRRGLLGNRSFGQYFGMIALRRAVTAAIRAITGGIKEGSDHLVQYSAEYNASISSIVSSLNFLKNAWAAAFSPIVNAVAPYLSAFVDMIANALNAVGRFMAALTGKGFAVQAVKNWSDYAKSLDKTASSAGKAKDAADELKKTVMSFDELHLLNAPNESSGGSGGGSGSGSGGDVAISDMFKTIELPADDAMSNLGAKIGAAIKKDDWTAVGNILTAKLTSLVGGIDWTKVQAKTDSVSSKIAQFINGAIAGIGDEEFSSAIAGAIAVSASALDTFVTELQLEDIGNKIGLIIKKSIKKIPSNLVGQLLADLVNGGANLINGIFEADDGGDKKYGAIGSKIAGILNAAIGKIEAKDVGDAFGHIFNSYFGNIVSFFTESDFEDWGKKLGEIVVAAVGRIKLDGEGGVGAAIAGAINGAFAFVGGFVKTGALDSLGDLVAGEIHSAINGINWEQDGYNFGTFTASLLKQLGKFFDSETWGDLGAKIKEGIKGWFKGMKAASGWQSLGEDIRKALNALVNFMVECMPTYTEVQEAVEGAFMGIFEGFFNDTEAVNALGTKIAQFLLKAIKLGWEIANPQVALLGKAIEAVTGVNPIKNISQAIDATIDAMDGSTGGGNDGEVQSVLSDAWSNLFGKDYGSGGSSTHATTSGSTAGGSSGTVPQQGNPVTILTAGEGDNGSFPKIPIIGQFIKLFDNSPKEDKDINVDGKITTTTDGTSEEYKKQHPLLNIIAKVGSYTSAITSAFKTNNPITGVLAKFGLYDSSGITDSYKAKNKIPGMIARFSQYDRSGLTADYKASHKITSMIAAFNQYDRSGITAKYKESRPITGVSAKLSGYSGSGISASYKKENPLTGLIAMFDHWSDKGKNWHKDVGNGLYAVFDHWSDRGAHWSKDVGDLVALFDHWSDGGAHWSKAVGNGLYALFDYWDKAKGFNNTVDGMTIKSDYVDYVGDPVIPKPFTLKVKEVQTNAGVLKLLPMASGGIVNTGEVFLARESGPEMVGRIGRKTAVANNDQIAEGISAAVTTAMMAVLSQMNTNNNQTVYVESVLKTDDETLYRSVERGRAKARYREVPNMA